MPEFPPSAEAARRNTGPPHAPPSDTRTPGSVRALHLRISLLPAAAMALLGALTAVFLVATDPSPLTTAAVSAVAAVGAALVMAAAVYGAGRATRRVHGRIDDLRSASAHGRVALQRLLERVKAGERFQPRAAPAPPERDGDPFAYLVHELGRRQHAAETAVLETANLGPTRASEQQVEVFVNVARRMQSLVHREITLLDDLESQVEDPDLLKGLFTIDHLATRMRRQSESLAVLGGAASRRQWSKPVSLYEVLRSAVAEVEHYSRVKVVPPVTGTLDGSAVVDVIHLAAELIENATKFSPPHAQVLIRAEDVANGVAIDIEDRGLGMQHGDLHRMNGLLTDPGRIDVAELLRDGRIGLFVVSTLARKHGVRVQLQRNFYGGTQAVILLPNELIASSPRSQSQRSQDREAAHDSRSAAAEPVPALASTPSAAPSTGSSPRPSSAPQAPAHSPFPGSAPVRATPSGASRPPLPARVSRSPEAGQGRDREGHDRPEHTRVPAHAAAPSDTAPQRRVPQGERPPLPERKAQTHLAPQLRDAPSPASAPDRREPVADHTPGLMAAFQSGVQKAEAETEKGPPNPNDSTG